MDNASPVVITEEVARPLAVIGAGMGGGLVLLVTAALYLHATTKVVPSAAALRVTNILTIVASGYALTAIIASEFIWKSVLRRGTANNPADAVRMAWIIRTAMREGAALLGVVVCIISAKSGVMHLYPAYWANLAGAALFWFYLVVHWPSSERLTAEVGATLSGSL